MRDTLLSEQGLYTIPEAAQILMVRPDKLQRWANAFASERPFTSDKMIINFEKSDSSEEPLLSFYVMIELRFVSYFRGMGVSMPTIKAAARQAEKTFGSPHPFVVARFRTDGKSIFATLEQQERKSKGRESYMLELNRAQTVMDCMVQPFLKRLEYSGEELLRYFPLGPDAKVVLDPRRGFGKPIDQKSGVPTLVLFQMAMQGENEESIADWYGVEVKAVQDAVRFEFNLRERRDLFL